MKSLKIILIVICLFNINIAFSQNTKSTLNSSEIIVLKQNVISNVQYNTSVTDSNSTKVTDANSTIKSLEQALSHYVEAFNVIDRSFSLHIDTSADEIEIKEKSEPIIIVLGYALNLDGSMDNILVQRLKTALGAYNKYPNAKIIVSGGGVIAGVTESYQMEQWLIATKSLQHK